MALRLTNTQRKLKVPAGTLRKAAQRALSYLGFQDAELSVLITGDTKMRALNREFRGKDYATDVLSFPAHTGKDLSRLKKRRGGEGPPVVLGDVVISAPRAASQARELGHPFEEELVFLLVHGVLHLVGYDHEKGPAEDRAMRKMQRELMSRLDKT